MTIFDKVFRRNTSTQESGIRTPDAREQAAKQERKGSMFKDPEERKRFDTSFVIRTNELLEELERLGLAMANKAEDKNNLLEKIKSNVKKLVEEETVGRVLGIYIKNSSDGTLRDEEELTALLNTKVATVLVNASGKFLGLSNLIKEFGLDILSRSINAEKTKGLIQYHARAQYTIAEILITPNLSKDEKLKKLALAFYELGSNEFRQEIGYLNDLAVQAKQEN